MECYDVITLIFTSENAVVKLAFVMIKSCGTILLLGFFNYRSY